MSAKLTPCEEVHLWYMAQGRSVREVARELWVVEGTVYYHRHNLYKKLGAHNRKQALAAATEQGLLRR